MGLLQVAKGHLLCRGRRRQIATSGGRESRPATPVSLGGPPSAVRFGSRAREAPAI